MSFVYFQVYEPEKLESAASTSRGHLEDVPEDPNLFAVYSAL